MKEMTHDFLYGAEFDFPVTDQAARLTAVVMFVPRSGSNLLACLMAETGTLGFPLEYFSPRNLKMMGERLRGVSHDNVTPIVNLRTSRNGVFSFKWNGAFDQLSYGSNLYAALAPDTFIIVDREDRDAQARSLAVAQKTMEWVVQKGGGRSSDTRPSQGEISKAAETLDQHRTKIEHLLDSATQSVLRVTYEQILADPQQCIDKLAMHCGVMSGPVDINAVPIVRIARGSWDSGLSEPQGGGIG